MVTSAVPIVITGAVLATACVGGGSGDARSASDESFDVETFAAERELVWAACGEQPDVEGVVKECATLVVPLDYTDPDGETTDIAVARLSTSSADRIGSLVFNPGGPGGSGVDFVDQLPTRLPAEIAERFDLVSFDPRGVGGSNALACERFDEELSADEYDERSATEALESAEEYLAGCEADTLDLAPYVGTNNAARDLELLRESLGDDTLSYVGSSYGTRLGAVYIELFPDSVRAVVLDGAVKPTDDFGEFAVGQAEGFDRALENFAAACDADVDCILQQAGPTLEVFERVRAAITDAGSLDTDDPDRVLTPRDFETGVIAWLYSRYSWPSLAFALYDADVFKYGTALLEAADEFEGRNSDDAGRTAGFFVNCADNPARPDPDEYVRTIDDAADLATRFDWRLRTGSSCLGLDAPLDPLVLGPAEGAPPVLVVGVTGDPATPIEWAEEMATSLDSAVLYTVVAEGHTAYGLFDCVAEPVNAYLIDLKVPEEGASCSDNEGTDFFESTPSELSDVASEQADVFVSFLDCLRDSGIDVASVDADDIINSTEVDPIAEYVDMDDRAVIDAYPECEAILLQLNEI